MNHSQNQHDVSWIQSCSCRVRRTLAMAFRARHRRVAILIAAVAATVAFSPAASAQDGFRVVVNPSNPVSSLSRTQVSKLFLDKGAWDDGSAGAPVDLLPSSAI